MKTETTLSLTSQKDFYISRNRVEQQNCDECSRLYVGARQNPILQFINIQFISSNYYDLNRKLLLLAKVNFSKPKHTRTHKHTMIVLIFEGYFLSISNISFLQKQLSHYPSRQPRHHLGLQKMDLSAFRANKSCFLSFAYK